MCAGSTAARAKLGEEFSLSQGQAGRSDEVVKTSLDGNFAGIILFVFITLPVVRKGDGISNGNLLKLGRNRYADRYRRFDQLNAIVAANAAGVQAPVSHLFKYFQRNVDWECE